MDKTPFDDEAPFIDWSAGPPPAERRKIEVWTPRPGADVVALILSEQLVGVYTHFLPDAKATVPCLAATQFCEHCLTTTPRRWQGWLAGMSYTKGKLYLVGVTTNAVRACPILLQPKVTLRGGKLTLRRRGQANNSPVEAHFLPGVPKKELPAAFDVPRQLLTLWGIRRVVARDTPMSLPDSGGKMAV